MKRARQAAEADGTVIAFPRMPRVAKLPRGRRRWSPAEKIEHLLRMSLDQAHEILAWPTAELDPARLAVQGQVRHLIMMIGTKAALEGTLAREVERERDRERIVAELTHRFEAEAAGAAPEA